MNGEQTDMDTSLCGAFGRFLCGHFYTPCGQIQVFSPQKEDDKEAVSHKFQIYKQRMFGNRGYHHRPVDNELVELPESAEKKNPGSSAE